MPDGLLCLLAFLIAAAVATPQVTTRLQPLLMLGSMLAGLVTLNILPALPPASAADRFLCLLPLLTLADCCRATNTRRFTTLPNMLVLTAIAPTVLFRSVWLIQPASQTILGITPTGWLLLLGLTPLPVALALILQRLAAPSRYPDVAASLNLCLLCCLLCTGLAITLGGYLKGGLLALPLAGSLLPTALRKALGNSHAHSDLPLTLGWGSLISLLLIGGFFGRLTPIQCACFATIPLLTALPFPPRFIPRNIRRQILLRITTTALLCGLLLAHAWTVFAVRMLPLLASQHTPP